jgi:hypothetical protein
MRFGGAFVLLPWRRHVVSARVSVPRPPTSIASPAACARVIAIISAPALAAMFGLCSARHHCLTLARLFCYFFLFVPRNLHSST